MAPAGFIVHEPLVLDVTSTRRLQVDMYWYSAGDCSRFASPRNVKLAEKYSAFCCFLFFETLPKRHNMRSVTSAHFACPRPEWHPSATVPTYTKDTSSS